MGEKKLVAIMSTRGNFSEIATSIASFVQCGIHVIVVDQGAEKDKFRLQEKFGKSLSYFWTPGQRGISTSRNVALRNLPADAEYFVLAAETSICEPDWIAPVIKKFESDSTIGAICGRYQFGDSLTINPGSGELKGRGFLVPVEESFVFSTKILESGLLFNEAIGTGSKGLAWCGEGPELLYRVGQSGFTIPAVDELIGIGSRIFYAHRWIVEFKYGIGFSIVAKVIAGKKWTFTRAFASLAHPSEIKRVGAKHWIVNNLAIVLGRNLGFFIPSHHYDVKP